MKLVRFGWDGAPRWGVVADNVVYSLVGELWSNDMAAGDALAPLADVTILAPVPPVNKVIGIGLAYKDMYRAYERENGGRVCRDGPAAFMKPSSAVVAHAEPIVIPRICTRAIYEAELGVIIGRRASRVSADEALDYVGGYTCVNDATGSRYSTVEQPVVSTRMKIMDTFCPCGPVVETDYDPDAATVICRLNGREVQRSVTGRDMCYSVAEEIAWVTSFMTLEPGDMISTGAHGEDRIEHGDWVEIEIPGIGVLANPVVDEDKA